MRISKLVSYSFFDSTIDILTLRNSSSCLSIAFSRETEKIRPVASLADLRRQIDQLDRQIVDLLARRTKLMKGVLLQTDDEIDPDWQEQVLSNWLEQAFDFGLDEHASQKVCQAVMEVGKKTVEI